MPQTPPYGQPEYRLAGAALTRVSEAEASTLAAALASMDPWRRLGATAARLEAFLTTPDPSLHRFTVAVAGAPSGVVAVRTPWLNGPYLQVLGLFPGVQGGGIGGQILDWLAAEAPERAGNLWVLCSDFNERGLAFYRRAGFVDVAPLPNVVRPGFTEILLRRTL